MIAVDSAAQQGRAFQTMRFLGPGLKGAGNT